MKHLELYRKCKINYPAVMNARFGKVNLPVALLITCAALLTEPLIMYKSQRGIPFTWDYYTHQIERVSLILIPFSILILWNNWRESVKRKRGYGWVGKFEVLDKRASLFSNYLLLTPGHGNQISVDRQMFEKIRIGDFITVTRNSLGSIEEVKRLNNIRERLNKAELSLK